MLHYFQVAYIGGFKKINFFFSFDCFKKDDLASDDVMILDTGHEVWFFAIIIIFQLWYYVQLVWFLCLVFSLPRYLFGWDHSPVMLKGKWPSKVLRYWQGLRWINYFCPKHKILILSFLFAIHFNLLMLTRFENLAVPNIKTSF